MEVINHKPVLPFLGALFEVVYVLLPGIQPETVNKPLFYHFLQKNLAAALPRGDVKKVLLNHSTAQVFMNIEQI